MLGGLIGLVAAIYAWYTFYLGAPVLKKCPPEKAVPFTIVVVLCGIVLAIAARLRARRAAMFGAADAMRDSRWRTERRRAAPSRDVSSPRQA